MSTAPNLLAFTLADLAQFKDTGQYPATQSENHALFYVGRDDVHGVLAYLFGRVTHTVDLNIFGFDYDALNTLLMDLAENPKVAVQVTLDKSQSGGVHEK